MLSRVMKVAVQRFAALSELSFKSCLFDSIYQGAVICQEWELPSAEHLPPFVVNGSDVPKVRGNNSISGMIDDKHNGC